MERVVIKTNSIQAVIGLVFGFVIAMTTIIGGIYTALHNRAFLGGTLSFAGLAILVGAFLVNNKKSAEKK